jgi:hypothetical protein
MRGVRAPQADIRTEVDDIRIAPGDGRASLERRPPALLGLGPERPESLRPRSANVAQAWIRWAKCRPTMSIAVIAPTIDDLYMLVLPRMHNLPIMQA